MSADFTPTIGAYKNLGAFKFWCQKVLPAVYDDSLSYYELLCKVVKYLNEVIENSNVMGNDLRNLHNAYVSLQDWVNHYFDNLDIQEEINNKLDKMVEDGTLTDAIARYSKMVEEAIEQQQIVLNGVRSDVNVLENRMNTFTSLPAGSTSGDAELNDIRVGADGTLYPNAGDAVREQIKQVTRYYVYINLDDSGNIQSVSFNGQVVTNLYEAMLAFTYAQKNAQFFCSVTRPNETYYILRLSSLFDEEGAKAIFTGVNDEGKVTKITAYEDGRLVIDVHEYFAVGAIVDEDGSVAIKLNGVEIANPFEILVQGILTKPNPEVFCTVSMGDDSDSYELRLCYASDDTGIHQIVFSGIHRDGSIVRLVIDNDNSVELIKGNKFTVKVVRYEDDNITGYCDKSYEQVVKAWELGLQVVLEADFEEKETLNLTSINDSGAYFSSHYDIDYIGTYHLVPDENNTIYFHSGYYLLESQGYTSYTVQCTRQADDRLKLNTPDFDHFIGRAQTGKISLRINETNGSVTFAGGDVVISADRNTISFDDAYSWTKGSRYIVEY